MCFICVRKWKEGRKKQIDILTKTIINNKTKRHKIREERRWQSNDLLFQHTKISNSGFWNDRGKGGEELHAQAKTVPDLKAPIYSKGLVV